jgi:hypothetical protein
MHSKTQPGRCSKRGARPKGPAYGSLLCIMRGKRDGSVRRCGQKGPCLARGSEPAWPTSDDDGGGCAPRWPVFGPAHRPPSGCCGCRGRARGRACARPTCWSSGAWPWVSPRPPPALAACKPNSGAQIGDAQAVPPAQRGPKEPAPAALCTQLARLVPPAPLCFGKAEVVQAGSTLVAPQLALGPLPCMVAARLSSMPTTSSLASYSHSEFVWPRQPWPHRTISARLIVVCED